MRFRKRTDLDEKVTDRIAEGAAAANRSDEAPADCCAKALTENIPNEKKQKKDKLKWRVRFVRAWDRAAEECVFFLKENGRNVWRWSAVYVFLALLSLFVSDAVTGFGLREFPQVLFKLLPRIATLVIVTCPVSWCRYRKTATSVLAGLWFMWIAASYNNIIWGVPYLIIALLAASVLFLYERARPYETKYQSFYRHLTVWIYVFVLLCFLIEFAQTMDITAPIKSLIAQPDVLACNFLYVTAIGFFLIWCRKVKFAFCIYGLVWIVLAYASYLKCLNVYEPVLLLDIFSVAEAITAAKNFLSIWDFIFIILLVAGVIAVVVWLAKKEKARSFHLSMLLSSVVYLILILLFMNGVSRLSFAELDRRSAKVAYREKGFPFSFMTYAFRSVVEEPEGYSDILVQNILDTVEKEYQAPNGAYPEVKNIIVIQMESFADPYLFPNVTYEKDPMPFIRSLMEQNTSGTVDVPVFGGQTVKSEFEFLTGLNMNYLPFGYSPYVQYLDKNAMDSFARYLSKEGFETTAIHNYEGEFFNRYQVYEQLGFHRFISYEFMSGVRKRGDDIWAGDEILVNQIGQVLDAGKEQNHFIYTVTVQLHGSYEPIQDEADYPMKITAGNGYNAAFKGRIAYYVSQMMEFDRTIQTLIAYLEARGEPTYVLFYSDHLPNLFASIDELSDEEKFTTQFFTWNNIGIEEKKEPVRIELHQLSTYLCNILGLKGSFMNRFHSVYSDRADYEENFKTIQYYKIYNEAKTANFTNPDYTLGLSPFAITAIVPDEEDPGTYVIYGSGFTDDTYLCVNGTEMKLEYESPNRIYLRGYDETFTSSDEITVRIKGAKYGTTLKESAKFTYSYG